MKRVAFLLPLVVLSAWAWPTGAGDEGAVLDLVKSFEALCRAQKDGDTKKVSETIKGFELPDQKAWFKKTFGDGHEPRREQGGRSRRKRRLGPCDARDLRHEERTRYRAAPSASSRAAPKANTASRASPTSTTASDTSASSRGGSVEVLRDEPVQRTGGKARRPAPGCSRRVPPRARGIRGVCCRSRARVGVTARSRHPTPSSSAWRSGRTRTRRSCRTSSATPSSRRSCWRPFATSPPLGSLHRSRGVHPGTRRRQWSLLGWWQ